MQAIKGYTVHERLQSVAVSQKIKHEITRWSRNFSSRYASERAESKGASLAISSVGFRAANAGSWGPTSGQGPKILLAPQHGQKKKIFFKEKKKRIESRDSNSLPELWSLEICSAWNLHGFIQQPWEWLIQEKKKIITLHWFPVTYWVVELQRQSRVTHCVWCGPRPAHVADALTQSLCRVRGGGNQLCQLYLS